MKRRLLALAVIGTVTIAGTPLFAQTEQTGQQISATQKKEKNQRILWGAKISPYVQKVFVTLEEKKIPYELKEILPTKLLVATNQEVPAAFSSISPLGKIPVYEVKSSNKTSKQDADFAISDSAVIMDYIDQTEKNNALRPTCPQANARVSWMIKYADDVLAPLTHKILFEKVVKPGVLKDTTDEAAVEKVLKEELPVVLDYLEDTLAKEKSTWISNTKNFSLADITIVAHLASLKKANLDLNEIIGKDRPLLLAYVTKVLDRDSFKKSMA